MFRVISIFFTLLLFTNIDTANAVYYVWGPEELEPTWTVLNAIAQFMSSSVYTNALLVFFLLGLLMLALSQLFSSRLASVGVFIGVVLLIHLVLYGPKVQVRIHDLTCDGWRTPIDCDRTVNNVPYTLAFMLDLAGAINKLAEHIGVTYGSISGGFPSKARCTEALTSLTLNQLRNSDTREDFITYVTGCIVPCSYLVPSLWQTIADSENLLSAFNLPAACSFLEVYDQSSGSNVSCTSFYATRIQSVFGTSLSNLVDTDWYDKVITRYCSTALSTSNVYGGKNNLDPEAIARQSILVDGLIASLQLAGGGVSENLKVRMLLTNQKLTTRAVLKAMSSWLKDVFPMIKAVAQVFLLGFFPLALLLALLPNATRGLVLYFMAFVGVALWTPAMAIANALVNWFGEWQTSVLMYSPATIYELKDKIWLSGAIGAVAYAIIPVVLALFTGGIVAGIWRGVFGAGSPVHLPETVKHQAADPLGAQRAGAELAQRIQYENRGELVSAGMFAGAMEAQRGISTAQQSLALGLSGAGAGAIAGTKQAYQTNWHGQMFNAAGSWMRNNGAELRKAGYDATITDTGMISIRDLKTGDMVATVNPMSGMVSMAKPDLALSAVLSKGWQKAKSAVLNESLSTAYSIAYSKAYGHDVNKGIDKVAQDLQSFSHTEAGANYRQFVSSIANETKADEQDVHRAVSILQASAGPDGRLTVSEAQKAMNMAARRGGGVAQAMAAILGRLGFQIRGDITGRGSSESIDSSTYTVSSSEGDNYSVSWSKNDEWRMLTQTTMSVAKNYRENWTENERQTFDKNLGLVTALSNSESVAETLGLNMGVNLERDIDRWARERYGYGQYLRMLDSPDGRERLLKEYLEDKLQERMGAFNTAKVKEEFLQRNGVNRQDIYKAWSNFRRTGDTEALKSLGLNDSQIQSIKDIYQNRGETDAYSAMLDYLLENRGIRSRVDGQVPEEISQAPQDVDSVQNLEVKGVSEQEVRSNIDKSESKVNAGKNSLRTPTPDNARRGVSLSEALSRVPHQALASGVVMGLATLAAEKGLDWFASRGGKSKPNILDEVFTKEEQAELRQLREKALKGDAKAAQEYLEKWQSRMAELEKKDPIKLKRLQEAMKDMENIMEDKGFMNRLRGVVDNVVKHVPDFGKRIGTIAGEALKVLGVADLLTDTSPAYAPTAEVRTAGGFTYNKGTLAQYGLTVDDNGHLRVNENLTSQQREALESIGVQNINPGQVITGQSLEAVRNHLSMERQPLNLSPNMLNELRSNPEVFRQVLSTQQERPVMYGGNRVMLDSEGNVYDYKTLQNYGLTVDDNGHLRVNENLTPQQREMLMRYGIDPQDMQVGYVPPDAESRLRSELAFFKAERG